MDQSVGLIPVLVTQALSQVLFAVVLAALLLAFHRVYGGGHLRRWALSWAALVAYMLVAPAAGLTTGRPSAFPVLAALALVAGYLQVAWLLLGAFALGSGEPLPRRTERLAVGTAVLAGVVSSAPPLLAMHAPSIVGVRCLVAGSAYLAGALALLRGRPSLARGFAGAALAVYGLDQLAYFGLGFLPRGRQGPLLPLLMSVDLLATAVIGIALVTWLLAEERERQARAASLLAQKTEALRQEQSRLRLVLEQVPAVLWTTDEQLRFTLSVGSGLAALSLEPNQVVGTTVQDFLGEADPSIEPHRRALRGESATFDSERAGRSYLTRVEPLHDAAGAIRGTIGFAVDLTRQRDAEQALRRAVKEESLAVLAGAVAHDFTDLVAAVLGHASMALALIPGGEARHHVEKAAEAVERAAELTRKMLAYSGHGRFVVQHLDLETVLRDELPLLEMALPDGVRLATELGEGVPPIDADPAQMQQVLVNLVINAGEAVAARGGTVTIATGVRDVSAADGQLWQASGQPLAPGRYVSLEVRDDGPGMDAATRARIFDPFFSTKSTGRGLGLPAVLGVVRGHRAALSVDSEPGRGTAFRLLFAPAASVADSAPLVTPAPATGEPAPPAPPPTAPAARPTLLLVDDEPIVRQMVSEVLETAGYTVVGAADGAEAIEVFERRRGEIDLVLLDLSMPGLSGDQTYARLRQIDPALRVVLSSGYDQEEATRGFGAFRPMGFLQKPYRPPELVAEIERCLGRPARPRDERE